MRSLFDSNATVANKAGGRAYELGPREALAQISHTGCFGDTYYAEGKDQLTDVLNFARLVEPEFVAKCAIHSRKRGQMKDMPAVLLGFLVASGNTKLARAISPRVVDNGKMLRNFVQVMRSGQLGRKNVSSACTSKIVQRYFDSRSPERIFRDSVGNSPSLKDVLKLCRPAPKTPAHDATFAYLVGKSKEHELPSLIAHYEAFKAGHNTELPDVPFQMLTGVEMSDETWKHIARTASWTTTRMNLNTFHRHNVFTDKALTQLVIDRLRDPDEVKRSRCFPYQLLTAYQNTTEVPADVRDALQDAMETAVENVPAFEVPTVVAVDVSGSMSSAITGRSKAPSKTRCVDVAALIGAVILRRNRAAVIPFDLQAYKFAPNRRDSVMTLATQLARYGGGGTDCSLPIQVLNQFGPKDAELVIMVSDNESWADKTYYGQARTGLSAEWKKYKRAMPTAKLVCIDLTPNHYSQARQEKDTLCVGGFSDNVFDVIKSFVEGQTNWISEIEKVSLDEEAAKALD